MRGRNLRGHDKPAADGNHGSSIAFRQPIINSGEHAENGTYHFSFENSATLRRYVFLQKWASFFAEQGRTEDCGDREPFDDIRKALVD